uniref:hypothetical protein n=1 Tax=uncultured Bilophila sp. TaxID=529385 RepID=UPI0026054331
VPQEWGVEESCRQLTGYLESILKDPAQARLPETPATRPFRLPFQEDAVGTGTKRLTGHPHVPFRSSSDRQGEKVSESEKQAPFDSETILI